MKKKLHKLSAYWREILVTGIVFLGTIFAGNIGFLQGVAEGVDTLLFRSQPFPATNDIVIVGLDDKTLNHPDFKRYQDIHRGDHAKVLEYIASSGAAAVGVDVFFYQESENISHDQALQTVVSDYPNIVIAEEFDYSSGKFLTPPESIVTNQNQKGYINVGSISNYSSAVQQVALILPTRKSEGVVYPVNHEPLAVKVLKAQEGVTEISMRVNDYRVPVGDGIVSIPEEQNGGLNIRFHGGPNTYKVVSFYDVWNGTVPAEVFTGKTVFVGATAHDIHDEYFTPTARVTPMPGVEIHAHAFQTVRDQSFLSYQSTFWLYVSVATLLVLLLLFVANLPFWQALLGAAALSIGWYGAGILLFVYGNVITSWFWPLTALWISFSVIHIWRFLTAEKQKLFLRDMFGRYVSPDVVKQMTEQGNSIELAGEERRLSLWFSDIVGFTTLSESLTPKQSVQLLNIYLGKISPLILENQGTIDKFLGDGIMVFWGAPLDIDNPSYLACKTALEHRRLLGEVNTELVAQGLPQINVRIGLHTGDVNVGNIGTNERLEYTAIGDGVNLASRLEGINKAYGTFLLVSEDVYKDVQKDFFVRELDLIRVKGKEEAVRIYELVGEKRKATKQQEIVKDSYEKGLEAYRAKDWEEARTWFALLKDDAPSQRMLERISILKKQKLPSQWDGVFVFQTK